MKQKDVKCLFMYPGIIVDFGKKKYHSTDKKAHFSGN